MAWKKVVPSNNPKQPEVTDEDREAAAKALGYQCWADATDYRLTGVQDREVARYVAAFARHRIATRERVLEEAARMIEQRPLWTMEQGFGDAAAAIRAMIKEEPKV